MSNKCKRNVKIVFFTLKTWAVCIKRPSRHTIPSLLWLKRWKKSYKLEILYIRCMKIINDWKFIILLCLTLGLAPFSPEPHLLGKIRWIVGGAHGMQLIDWFDTFFHGFPYLLLIRLLIVKLLEK